MIRRLFSLAIVAGVATALSLLGLRAADLQIPSNVWAPGGDMVAARAGASATLLDTGSVLVSGGMQDTGVVATTERFDPQTQSFVPTAPMWSARANHTSTHLPDGRVLVAGGTGADGLATASAELYDPATENWTPVASLHDARTGHTATVLYDGRVVIAGGNSGSASLDSIEVYDPDTATFLLSTVSLSAARTGHAAALLYSGKVLVVGGFDGTNILSSVDLYDPYFDSLTPEPSMSVARAGHSATTLLSGQVLIVGGADDAGELASGEIYDPATHTNRPTGNALAAARQRHQAFLLPHNNHVLIVGGTSSGKAVPTTETFREWQGDGGTFAETEQPASARTWATGAALSFPAALTIRSGPTDGVLLLAGGSATADASQPFRSAELYGFATVKTDLADYAPGTTVTITGAKFASGATVTFGSAAATSSSTRAMPIPR